MKLVTTDPDTYVVHNTAGFGVLSFFTLIIVAPPLIVPTAVVAMTARLLASLQWHPMFVAIGTIAAGLAFIYAVVLYLTVVPVAVGGLSAAAYVGICYGLFAHYGLKLDWIWSSGLIALTAWVGWNMGQRASMHLHIRRRRRGTSSD